jgi:hypothetical protein
VCADKRPGRKTILRPIIGLTASSLVAVVALTFLVRECRWLAQIRSADELVEVAGVLESATAEVSFGANGPSRRLRVRYRYSYGGKEYLSDRYALVVTRGLFNSDVDVEETLASLRSMQPLRVYVFPSNPGVACLDNSTAGALNPRLPIAALATVGFGLGVVLSGVQLHRALRAEPGQADSRLLKG